MVVNTFFRMRHFEIAMLFMVLSSISYPVDARSPFLKVQNNGYQNVVVAVDPETPVENAVDLVAAIKGLFTQVSIYMHQATRSHLYLSQVTVLIPEKWHNIPEELNYHAASYETYEEADVRVDLSGPSHANEPSTLRAQGCGEIGEHVRLSTNFITESKDGDLLGSAKAVVKEWAKYRYGVFDECGIPNDPVHPTYYYTGSNNTVAPTNCVNVERLAGKIDSCDASLQVMLPHPSCDFKPTLPASATSSLMYMPYLPQVTEFCDDTTHNRLAPTKHNAMCREQSVWDVIKNSDDFLNVQPQDIEENLKTPTFKVLKAVRSSYVLLLDTSFNVTDTVFADNYEATKVAVGSFIVHHVPLDSVLGLVEFNSEVKVHRDLKKITTSKTRDYFKNGIPVTHASATQEANAAKALSTAINVTFAEGSNFEPVRPVIIMVTAGNWLLPFAPEVKELCDAMIAKKIRLDILLLKSNIQQEVHVELQKLITCTSGNVRLILGDPSTTPNHRVTLAQELGAALRESLRVNLGTDHVVQLHSNHISNEETHVTGSFQVDGSVGSNTHILVGYDGQSSVLDVTVTSPNDVTFGNGADDYVKDAETKTVGFAFPMVQAGKWTYHITRPAGGALPLTVTVTSQAQPGRHPIRVRAWTNVAYLNVSTGSIPVIIYAEVKQGQDPVANAVVEAEVELPSKLGSTMNQITTALSDDGSGDPDVNSGDGIYSTYFTTMPDVGFYRIRIRVKGSRETMLRGETSAPNSKDFFGCQRQTVLSNGRTGVFDRLAVSSSFYVSKVSEQDDPYPPARISDLRLESVNSETKEATVAWTAVGDNYHDSLVNSYDVRIDTTRKQVESDDLSHATKPEVTIVIQPPRLKQTAVIKLLDYDKLFYLTVRGMDKSKNPGLTSNIIGILIPKPPPSTASSPLPTVPASPAQQVNETVDKKKAQTASVGAGAIVGIVIAAVLIVVIVAIVFIVTTKRRREEQRRRKEKRYQAVPREKSGYEEEQEKIVDSGGSPEEGNKRGSQSKGIASSNTSV